jgi:hypothetical protein
MTFARTCYDHLAGRVGVAVHDALITDGTLVAGGDGYLVTAAGEGRLGDLGVDVAALRASRRTFARGCLDFTERRQHLAGALGADVCRQMIELGWFVRRAPGQRSLRLTQAGRTPLTTWLGQPPPRSA